MATKIKSNNDVISNDLIENTPKLNAEKKILDPQVKITRNYSPRRSYDTAYKLRILSAYDACENSFERGVLLRKEGLYHSRIAAWKKQQANSRLNGQKKSSKVTLRIDHLTRENEQLKKKLAQAEAIIELQKKVSDLLGSHILPHKNSDMHS